MPDFALPDHLAELEAAARRLGERSLAGGQRDAEAAGAWPDDVLAVLADFSLSGLDLPETHGGVDAGALAKVVVVETLAAADPGGLPAVDRPGPAVGAVLACPDRALARASFDAALVVVDPDAGRPRLEWAPAWPAPTRAWTIEGDLLRLLEISADALTPGVALGFLASGCVHAPLGEAPVLGEWALGDGFGRSVRARARLWVAAVLVGIAQNAFSETIAYTTERIVFGKPVAHHQGNAFDLAAVAAEIHAARLATRDAASRFDGGDPAAAFWATEAWRLAADAAVRMTDMGVQLLGGHGFIVDHLAEKRFREARMAALLFGGRDSADADAAAMVLDVADPLFAL
ncbi:MAG TPA: acyl-CoA dehydrogenase family protein [Acidimicrobiales bacterium]|nr:acyl-CoA dehydrogenase family protein [Acidimicrobiales bacterium]